ncbi:hypothetical protein TIFTF001_056409 [Ficus carica]|uniref:Uncharacterized protein n=1 Tax=Ficus carica TaxID=3494 RepID=A0AA88EIG8_FICCA|nr:hypothetical protein TIFTF001_056409 [Ficus carica]
MSIQVRLQSEKILSGKFPG